MLDLLDFGMDIGHTVCIVDVKNLLLEPSSIFWTSVSESTCLRLQGACRFCVACMISASPLVLFLSYAQ